MANRDSRATYRQRQAVGPRFAASWGCLMQASRIVTLRLLVLVIAAIGSGTVFALESGPGGPLAGTADPLVRRQLETSGRADVVVTLAEMADLAPAAALGSKEARGRFVLASLQQTAARSQRELRALLDRRGVSYKPFFIANSILVRGATPALLGEIAARPEVARVDANRQHAVVDPSSGSASSGEGRGVEANLVFVGAPQVWSMGITGQGTVIAVHDTGLDEDHPAIRSQYRGCLNPPSCTVEDHDRNWWDATGAYPSDPWDGNGHGTFCTGVAVGDDGGANQIGMAPGAKTIHCKVLTDGGGTTDADIMECFQWDLAPWNLAGLDPDPAAAPDIVSISWGYPGGGYGLFRDAVRALNAAGIVVVALAGSDGPGCATLRSPGDYQEVLTVSGVDHTMPYPGELTSWSSRGPSTLDPSPPYHFPDVTTPAVNIRSSFPGGVYQGGWSGTGPATPHAAGLVALMWSACPGLRGQVSATLDIIHDTAVPLTGQPGSGCGGDSTVGPNTDWGHGTIDAVSAVQAALDWCDGVVFRDGFESGDSTAWSSTVIVRFTTPRAAQLHVESREAAGRPALG